ncbi:hypothetical protein CVT25_008814 [Psilocybe cyanescens]|uniref:Uncharacterized protein n=1 Tax=Psilocybe cyanescens TaxID=93625 RepID=A0A409XN03_PSICY|nr:hypothetical protein CVT25_008814 [Psilocybe cyanescens]
MLGAGLLTAVPVIPTSSEDTPRASAGFMQPLRVLALMSVPGSRFNPKKLVWKFSGLGGGKVYVLPGVDVQGNLVLPTTRSDKGRSEKKVNKEKEKENEEQWSSGASWASDGMIGVERSLPSPMYSGWSLVTLFFAGVPAI